MNNYVSYYRVSTKQQGDSGLGLEAQRSGVIKHMGCNPIMEFTDIQSGNRKSLHKRLQVKQALDYCKKNKLPLVCYKLDRFSRDVMFFQEALQSGVSLVFCDCPMSTGGDQMMNRLVLTILSYVAEMESRKISSRTKDALASKSKRGESLGRNILPSEYQLGAISTAKRYWNSTKSMIVKLHNEGHSLEDINKRLSDIGSKHITNRILAHYVRVGTMIDGSSIVLK